MELKDAVIAIRGTLKRDQKELQAAWLTISEHFASIERPKMADQFVPAWRRERAGEIGLTELTDDDIKKSWQLGEAVGGAPGPRLLIESECPAATPKHILQWLRARNKPAAERAEVESVEPIEMSQRIEELVGPMFSRLGNLLRSRSDRWATIATSDTRTNFYDGVTLARVIPDAETWTETKRGWRMRVVIEPVEVEVLGDGVLGHDEKVIKTLGEEIVKSPMEGFK